MGLRRICSNRQRQDFWLVLNLAGPSEQQEWLEQTSSDVEELFVPLSLRQGWGQEQSRVVRGDSGGVFAPSVGSPPEWSLD